MECSYQCGVHLPRRLMAEHEHDICPQRPTNVIVESFTKKMEERLEKELEKMDTRLKTIETDLATESERRERDEKEMDTYLVGQENKIEVGHYAKQYDHC